MKAIMNARVVLPDKVINGYILFSGGQIIETGCGNPTGSLEIRETVDAGGQYVGPGFVNIHCHAANDRNGHEDPLHFAMHHLEAGTTSLVCSIYQSVGYKNTLLGIKKLRTFIERGIPGNLAGIHLEGPYLNQKYGVNPKTARGIDPEEYLTFMDVAGGWIRHWTFAPEVPGVWPFVEACVARGIVPAIGHSEASPEQVDDSCSRGARIFTHLCNAAGASIDPTRFAGTLEVRSDEAAMLHDEVYCEIIPDANGVHVRPHRIRLIVKTVGIDRVVVVTDTFVGSDKKLQYPTDDIRSAGDCNFVDGALAGNSMTMDMAFQNIKKHAGLDIVQAFRVCAGNPAAAIGIGDRVGSIERGKQADFVFLDDELRLTRVFLKGEEIHIGTRKDLKS